MSHTNSKKSLFRKIKKIRITKNLSRIIKRSKWRSNITVQNNCSTQDMRQIYSILEPSLK